MELSFAISTHPFIKESDAAMGYQLQERLKVMEKMEIVSVSKSLIVYQTSKSFEFEVEIEGESIINVDIVCRLSIVNEE